MSLNHRYLISNQWTCSRNMCLPASSFSVCLHSNAHHLASVKPFQEDSRQGDNKKHDASKVIAPPMAKALSTWASDIIAEAFANPSDGSDSTSNGERSPSRSSDTPSSKASESSVSESSSPDDSDLSDEDDDKMVTGRINYQSSESSEESEREVDGKNAGWSRHEFRIAHREQDSPTVDDHTAFMGRLLSEKQGRKAELIKCSNRHEGICEQVLNASDALSDAVKGLKIIDVEVLTLEARKRDAKSRLQLLKALVKENNMGRPREGSGNAERQIWKDGSGNRKALKVDLQKSDDAYAGVKAFLHLASDDHSAAEGACSEVTLVLEDAKNQQRESLEDLAKVKTAFDVADAKYASAVQALTGESSFLFLVNVRLRFICQPSRIA
jgi:hypothetical protein